MRDAQFGLSDGRALAYTDIGEPDWPCVFFFHGAPSSRLRVAYLEERFLEMEVRVVSPDRPSYGGSSPQPGRTMADWPSDVVALADALSIERFMVAGHSSGGPYALACAALLPQRVTAAITLGGITDMGWEGAWDGYVDSEVELMRAPDEEAAVAWCVERFGADGSGFMAASGFTISGPDEALYEDEEVAGLLAAARAEAFRLGVAGYAQDCYIQGRPWPFDPGAIAAPVRVLHGDKDALMPSAHARHTAALIPGATLAMLPDHGHFTILAELPTMVSTLSRT